MKGVKFRNIDTIGVSVVIVCYNGKNRITSTLDYLAAQKGIHFPWEVILVDNNSNDNTGTIAWQHWKETGLDVPFTVIPEKRPGTMYARNTGIVSASFRYLLYVDDDNWLAENYLKTAYEAIRCDDAIAAVGGKGIMVFEEGFTPPVWVARYEKSYGCGPQGKKDGDTTYDQGWLYTAGAILDRVWLDRLYRAGFESALKGRDGRSLAPGEDTELTYALKIIGGRLFYTSELTFKHFMPRNRMTWEFLRKQYFAFGHSGFVLIPYRKHFGISPGNYSFHRLYTVLKGVLMNLMWAIHNGFSPGNLHTLYLLKNLGDIHAMLVKRYSARKATYVVKKLVSNVNFWVLLFLQIL
jgi:glycosyltransferase involved in cell wall biosynthesis